MQSSHSSDDSNDSAHPHGYYGESGMGQHGTELSPLSAGACVSGVSHHRMRGHLCGACKEHRHGYGHHERHLDLHGLHGAVVLHAL